MMRTTLLGALISVPIFYYFALIAGAATYPGYSHVTRYASELGAADAPHPALFNIPIMIGGIAALLGAFGLALALPGFKRPIDLGDGGRHCTRALGDVDGDGRHVPDAEQSPRRLRSRSAGTPSAGLRAARTPKRVGYQRNENVPRVRLCWLDHRSGDHVRRRPSSDAPKRRHLAADKYRYLDSMAGDAWILVVSADEAAI